MKFYNLLIKYRLWIGLALLALGGYVNYSASFWPAFPLYLIALILVLGHFFFGPLRLIQEYMENGDMDGAEKVLNSIKFPNLLYKPIRSSYYMLQANFSTMGEDLDKAESDLKKGLASGMPEKEYEGTAYLQLGSISYKKGNKKEAMEYLRKAVKIGLPDEDSKATAFLQLSSICIERRDFKSGKIYFNKAKACKPTNQQIIDQVKEMTKYIARIPG